MRIASFFVSASIVSLAIGAAPAFGRASETASPATAEPVPNATPVEALPTPSAEQAAAMLQTFARMQAARQQLRVDTRDRMLAALSPAHRGAVATLVGQLAIAPNPDRVATARRQLDATLSPSERDSILRIDAVALSESSGLARQMQAQLMAALTAEQRAAMERQMAQARATFERSLSPERRAAFERASSGPGLPLVLSPVSGTSPVPTAGVARDAGSVLLHALTLPDAAPFGFTSLTHTSGATNALLQAAPAAPSH